MTQFELIEVKSENGKDYYIEGYISTTDPDFVNDIVDEEGQKAIYEELVGKEITMDEEHEEWRDPKTGKLYDGKKNKYPLAKVVDARLDEVGTWAKAELNKYHPNFKERILPMIREGYLHSFSIAYNVTKYFHKVLDGIKYRVIQGLNMANVAITGNPVNHNASFNLALKSYIKMVEEKTLQELQTSNQELKSQVENLVTSVQELKGGDMDYKKKYEEMKAEYDKMKAELDKMKKDNGDSNEGKKEGEDGKKEMKSAASTEFEEMKAELKSLKEQNEKLQKIVESPNLKSFVEGKSRVPAQEEGTKNQVTAWDFM